MAAAAGPAERASGGHSLSDQAEHRHRLGEALERERPALVDGEAALEADACPSVDQDLPALRLAAQPRRQVDHAADRGVIEPALVAHRPERRVAVRDPDPQVEVVTELLPALAQR